MDKGKTMREKRALSVLMITINIIGIICLIYFSIPYFTHDNTVQYPNAMLPAEAWDRAGMILTFGLIPLLAGNVLGFLFVRTKQRLVRFLFFIPSTVCVIIVISYWVAALT